MHAPSWRHVQGALKLRDIGADVREPEIAHGREASDGIRATSVASLQRAAERSGSRGKQFVSADESCNPGDGSHVILYGDPRAVDSRGGSTVRSSHVVSWQSRGI